MGQDEAKAKEEKQKMQKFGGNASWPLSVVVCGPRPPIINIIHIYDGNEEHEDAAGDGAKVEAVASLPQCAACPQVTADKLPPRPLSIHHPPQHYHQQILSGPCWPWAKRFFIIVNDLLLGS
ncbi:hypothetical protein ACLKA6_001231 [Drosophila palustris]